MEIALYFAISVFIRSCVVFCICFTDHKMGRKKKHAKKSGYETHSYGTVDHSPSVEEEASKMFTKKFTFEKPTDDEDQEWNLPAIEKILVYNTDCVQQNETLAEMKMKLNEIKSLLSDKDIEKWHEHTMFTNKAGRIVPQIRSHIKPELCTQAWCKFHEIICTFKILPQRAIEDGQLCTLHLCEAPGAFITSLNHYLKTNNVDVQWNWLASTLNPYYEGNDLSNMIPDDRFIYETLDHWCFGTDNTGDITDVNVMKELVGDKRLGDVHLITADGSIDCQIDPAEQEALVSHLHYCEVITALQCLSSAGTLVLKMFTFFEHSSVSLMYLLNCVFEKVHVFKPATSKSGNSEVYVVCLNFTGKAVLQSYFPKLTEKFGPALSMYLFSPANIPLSFIQQLTRCAKQFKDYQCETIETNIKLHMSMSLQEKRHIEQVRDCCLQMYIEKFGIKYIPREQQICSDLYKHEYYLRNQIIGGSKARQVGSFNERRNEKHWWQHLETTVADWFLKDKEDFILSHSREITDEEIPELKAVTGKCIKRLHTSRFVSPKLLGDFNMAIDTAQMFLPENRQILDEILSSSNGTTLSAVRKIITEDVCKVIQSIHECPVSMVCVGSKEIIDHVFEHKDVKDKVKMVNTTEDCSLVEPSDHLSYLYRFGQEYASTIHLITVANPIIPCVDKLTDLTANHNILYTAAVALKRLLPGGYLIITTPTRVLLTRFTVGLLYILNTCFEQVVVHCVSTFPSHCVIFCQNYQRKVSLMEYLWTILEDLRSLQENDDSRDIVEILPMRHMYDHVFYKAIIKLNEYILKTQLTNLIHMEKPLGSWSSSLVD